MGARLAVVAALLLAFSGCGSDDDAGSDAPATASSDTVSATPSATPASSAPAAPKKPAIPAGAPQCKEVWVGGKALPGSYKGCVQGKKYLKAEILSCSSGQGIVRHDQRFWAVRGGTISQAPNILKDRTYLDSVARCRG